MKEELETEQLKTLESTKEVPHYKLGVVKTTFMLVKTYFGCEDMLQCCADSVYICEGNLLSCIARRHERESLFAFRDGNGKTKKAFRCSGREWEIQETIPVVWDGNGKYKKPYP